MLIGVSKGACCGRPLLKSTDGFLTRVCPGTASGKDTVLFAVSLLGARRHIDNMGPKFNILFLKRDVEDVPYLLIKSVNFCNGSR